MTVHQLICEAFHGEKPEGMVVSHINENSLDNRSVNLEWATYKQNSNMPKYIDGLTIRARNLWTPERRIKHIESIKEGWRKKKANKL